MAERRDFEGLNQGQFWRVKRWRKDEEFNEKEGSGARSQQPLDMIEDPRPRPGDEHVWFIPNYAMGGDYGGSLVQKSNYEVLLEEAERLSSDELDGDDTWFQALYGSHGSYAIAFHVERTPDEILEMINSLEEYPLLDEGKHSEMEIESQNEAWEGGLKEDYRGALVSKFGGTAEGVADDALWEHFQEAAEAANEHWVNEEGDTSYIDVERVVERGADEPPMGMRYFFAITYYVTDADDMTETEQWYVLAPDKASAKQSFEESVKGGDETIWGFEFSERPEHSGDDDYYVTILDLDRLPPDATQEDIDSQEPDVHMLRIGKVEQVEDDDDVDFERLTE